MEEGWEEEVLAAKKRTHSHYKDEADWVCEEAWKLAFPKMIGPRVKVCITGGDDEPRIMPRDCGALIDWDFDGLKREALQRRIPQGMVTLSARDNDGATVSVSLGKFFQT